MQRSGQLGGYGLIASLLVLWPGAVPFATAQPNTLPQPELITHCQGLFQAFVPNMLQDRQGSIWGATRDGLRFNVFQPRADGRPSLSFAGVSRLSLDQQGHIRITSELGHLDRFDPFTQRFVNVARLRKGDGPAKARFFLP